MPARTPVEFHTLFRGAFNLGHVHALAGLYERDSQLITRGPSTKLVRKQPGGAWLFVIENPFTPA